MIMDFPAAFEQKITGLLGISGLNMSNQPRYKKRLDTLREQMVSLSDDFSGFRSSEDYHSDAYLAYNFPFNLMKSLFVAQKAKGTFIVPAGKKDFSILDIGCGEGAGMFGLALGMSEYYGMEHFSLTGMDASEIMLDKCREMQGALSGLAGGNAALELVRRTVDDRLDVGLAKKYDAIIFANSLLEIIPGEYVPADALKELSGMLNEDGLLVIIEPALKGPSRRLMALRDELIKNQAGFAVSPCLHDSMCPLLGVKSRDEWCHQSLRWNPPDYIKVLNQGLNREIDFLKFSYLVIAKTKHKEPPNGCLVVSNLLKEKGRKRCFLCTPHGRVELARLDRHKSEANKLFDAVHRGDILELQNHAVIRPLYWQAKEDSKITRLKD